MSEDAEILFEQRGSAGIVTLNRPKALNALTLPMIRAMHAKLVEWAGDARISRVVIRGAGGKAFCAGGDIRQLRAWGLAGDPNAQAFYREEYLLNAYIKRYPKPYVALIDGIVMGGGAGVSIHGSHRIATERTMFAMPETGIGFFPDVGATHFLPRLPMNLGTYLAMTGTRLGGEDMLLSGLATHAVPSDSIERLTEELGDKDELGAILSRHAGLGGEAPLASLMPAIDRCFGAPSVREIVTHLESETGKAAAWVEKSLHELRTKCPVSIHIALRQMALGADAEIEDCMRIEYRIANRILENPDFFEGVRAVIVDKDNRPRWSHADLGAVTPDEVDRYFASLGAGELKLLGWPAAQNSDRLQ
jgi:enoyl-CoA hydratase